MIIENLQVVLKDNKYIVSDETRSFGIYADTLETDSYWFCSINQLQQIKDYIVNDIKLIQELNKVTE